MGPVNHGLRGARENLLKWRSRYDRDVYPEKIASNLFYEVYPYGWCWDNRRLFFGDKMTGLTPPRCTPDTALRDTTAFIRNIQLKEVHPRMGEWMAARRDVGTMSHKLIEPLVAQSKSRSNQATEELEYTYSCSCAVTSCLNVFFAAGSMGLAPQRAFGEATGAIVADRWVTSTLMDLMTATQNVILSEFNAMYAPMADLY